MTGGVFPVRVNIFATSDGITNALTALMRIQMTKPRTPPSLVGMWVAPQLRGTGVASQLVEQVVAWARLHRRSGIVLTVEGDNGRAAHLYEKCGFAHLAEPPQLPYEPRPGDRFYEYTVDAR